MATKTTTIIVDNFSGLINRGVSQYQRNSGDLFNASNLDSTEIGSVRKTKGYSQKGNTMTSTTSTSSSTSTTTTSTSTSTTTS